MMRSAMQLKAIMRNVSKEKSADGLSPFLIVPFLGSSIRWSKTVLLLDITTLKQDDIVTGIRTGLAYALLFWSLIGPFG